MAALRLVGLSLAVAIVGAGVSLAQERDDAIPLFGTINLSARFMPDPVSIEVVGGGTVNPSDQTGCGGQVGAGPTLRLNYEAGGFPLAISLGIDSTAALAVMDPDGAWMCGAGEGGPVVTVFDPQSGQYDIWVGSIDGEPVEATVFISEVSPGIVVATQKITWLETAVHLRTNPRSGFDFVCPPVDDPSQYPVWGTDIYTDSSSICAAAVHAGAITLDGGPVKIIRLDGLDGLNAYPASTRNGIVTLREDDWFWSFAFIDPDYMEE